MIIPRPGLTRPLFITITFLSEDCSAKVNNKRTVRGEEKIISMRVRMNDIIKARIETNLKTRRDSANELIDLVAVLEDSEGRHLWVRGGV